VPYEIIYDRATGDIRAARLSAGPGKGLVLAEDQARLFADVDLRRRPVGAYRVNPGTNRVVVKDRWVRPEAGVGLELSTDPDAVSPVDPGAVEVPADGTSLVTFTVQKRSLTSGRALTGAQHDNLLTIRTTAGTLSARQVPLDNGRASFTLRSSTETVVAEVRVSADRVPGLVSARVEFAPLP
jgi:hypothetical protein